MRKFLSQDIDKLALELSEKTETPERKEIIAEFYKNHIEEGVKEDLQNIVGKWLIKIFLGLNILVVTLIVIYAGVDILFHIDNPDKRFVDGEIMGGLITAVVAEAVGAFIIFSKFIFR